MLYFSDALKQGALVGIKLSLGNIIPTLFPFFILSDLWTCHIEIKKDSLVGKMYERIFNLNRSTLPAYILGTVCGFPLGVRYATRQYEAGGITKVELEHLSSFANNPSAAFVISGIGAGLYNDIWVGVRLYSAVVLSSALVGIVFRAKEDFLYNYDVISRQSFSLVNSIKSAGASSLTVSCYIIFFSSIISALTEIIKSPLILTLTATFLEITNAGSLAAALATVPTPIKCVITAFALGFSGFSVHMQAFSILPREISKIKYLTMKLLQGVLCAVIMYVITLI